MRMSITSDRREGVSEEAKIDRRQYIAERLVEARTRLGLSALEVSKRAGINQPTLWRYENAKFARLDVITLVKVAKVLGVGLDQLTGVFNDEVEIEPADDSHACEAQLSPA